MVRDYNGPVRAIIVDKYSDMGTIVIGKMESGVVIKNQNLVLMPNKVRFSERCFGSDMSRNHFQRAQSNQPF